MFIYVITNNLNGMRYVGKTTQIARNRWNAHKALARRGNTSYYLHRAMNKYGVENFSFEVVATASSVEELDALEIQWIRELDTYNANNGYNMTSGGDCGNGDIHRGVPKPPEQRAKMSAHWTPERKAAKAAERAVTNAIMNSVLKNYTCPTCNESFTQVRQGVYSGHRKACRIKLGLVVEKKHKPHVTEWTPERRKVRAGIARKSASKRTALKNYTCPDCLRSFLQVSPGVYGGHRKYCMKRAVSA